VRELIRSYPDATYYYHFFSEVIIFGKQKKNIISDAHENAYLSVALTGTPAALPASSL
jgi:hypothetical protein